MSVVGALLLANVAIIMAAPPSYPILDSPETYLWNTLDKSEHMEVLRMALMPVPDRYGPLHSTPVQLDYVNKRNDKLQSPEVQRLVREMHRFMASRWGLTPEQMEEIRETGKLCDDDGNCIDFGGDWGQGCCPFG